MSSLEDRGNGSWRLTISDGYAPDGKKIRVQRTIHVDPMHTPAVQRREAEKQAALLEADFRHGSAPVSHRAVCRDELCRPCGVYRGQSLLAGRAAARWIKSIKKAPISQVKSRLFCWCSDRTHIRTRESFSQFVFQVIKRDCFCSLAEIVGQNQFIIIKENSIDECINQHPTV